MDVSSFSDVDVGVDLKSAAVSHGQFLSRVNQFPALYEGPVLHRAVWRYGQLWLPLAAEHGDEVTVTHVMLKSHSYLYFLHLDKYCVYMLYV